MSRRLDTAEAVSNATAGWLISIAAVHALWPLFGWQVNAAQSVAVTAIFWVLSAVRSYAIRRIFRGLQ